MRRLPRSFFARDTHAVARELLGKLLVRNYRGQKFSARITEVEAYIGESDLASHARFGKTKRNEIMFGKAGHTYIYLIYGMYDMLNIVTEQKDFPAAVLIRAAILADSPARISPACRPKPWRRLGVLAGPGKLTRAMKITRQLNGEDVATSKQLYVVDDGFRVPRKDIRTGPRIGVAYAGKHAQLPWRYYYSK